MTQKPSKMSSVSGLRQLPFKQHKPEDPLEKCKQLYEIKVDIRGPNHPETLTALHRLGNEYFRQHKFEKALAIFQEVSEKRRNVLGPAHPETLTSMRVVADTMSHLKRFLDAQRIYGEITNVQQGECEPSQFDEVMKMGKVLHQKGKYDEALAVYDYISELQRNLSADHPDVLEKQIRIVETLICQNKHDEALKLYAKVEDIQKKSSICGPYHQRTKANRCSVAATFKTQGKYDEALKIYLAVRKIEVQLEEKNTTILNQIAHIHFLRGNLDAAKNAYEEVYRQERKDQKMDASYLFHVQKNIASIYACQKKYDQAKKLLSQIHEKQIFSLGQLHPDTINTEQRLEFLKSIMELEPLCSNYFPLFSIP